jgi:hypothetical protein
MDQPLLQQEIESPVNRRWRRTTSRLAQTVQQLIGPSRRSGIQNHAEYTATQFREIGTPVFTYRLGAAE